jgi:YfiH family protein
MIPPDQVEVVSDFTVFGMLAFTTNRRFGSLSTASTEPVRDVMGRWDAVRSALSIDHGVHRLATASQVHGARIVTHEKGWRWTGWLRGNDADGHLSIEPGTGMAVTIADCVPVFIAHASGAAAILHSGWRGTAARIVEEAIALFGHRGYQPRSLHLHLGPAICGNCYEVSADVATRLLGERVSAPQKVDLRALIADHAHAKGVEHISTSPSCTRCDNDTFFSHRAGDAGRQVAVIAAS